MPSFPHIFKTATGKEPYAARLRLRTNHSLGTLCSSQLLEIPAGLGKTAVGSMHLPSGERGKACWVLGLQNSELCFNGAALT